MITNHEDIIKGNFLEIIFEEKADSQMPLSLNERENFVDELIKIGDIEGHRMYLRTVQDEQNEEIPLEKRKMVFYLHGGPHSISYPAYTYWHHYALK